MKIDRPMSQIVLSKRDERKIDRCDSDGDAAWRAIKYIAKGYAVRWQSKVKIVSHASTGSVVYGLILPD